MLKHRISKKDEVVQTLNSHVFKCSGGLSWRHHIIALRILSPFIYLDKGLVLLVENIALRLPRWLMSGKTCLKRVYGYPIENVFIEVEYGELTPLDLMKCFEKLALKHNQR